MTSASQTLFMIELRPNIQQATSWMLDQTRSIVRPGHDDGYGWHALLAAAFGDLAPKPFRLIERSGRPTQLLGYTVSDPEDLIERARRHADPAVYRALAIVSLDYKPMPAALEAGKQVDFEVRVRPTVRQDRDGDRRRSRERDAFLAAVDAEPPPRGQRPKINRKDVYRDWLTTRFGDAARIDTGTFRLQRLNRTILLRARQARSAAEPTGAQRRDLIPVGLLNRGVKGEQGGSPDAVMQGTLTITDPGAFHALLARGIGRHRSFGFGMLLLRPPRGG